MALRSAEAARRRWLARSGSPRRHAKFGQPEVKLGLLPGGGGTQRLPRLVGKGRALQLILTGETISAQEAYRIGLVNEVVSAADLIARAETILKQMSANAPIAVKFSLEAANKGTGDQPRRRPCRWKLPTSASAPPPKTRRKAPPPSSRSVRRSFRAGEGSPHTANIMTRTAMASDNIFSGLKVVDLASFIAGPSAAVILSDFGADVIKVEPPTRRPVAAREQAPAAAGRGGCLSLALANRNKRGIALDLKSPSAQQVLEKLVKWADVLIVNTPHPARARLKLEYEDVVRWNPRLIYADITGFGDKGPDADLPGFDITSYWARSGLLSMTRDAGAPPTWPVAGSGDNATAVGLYSAIVTALISSRAHGGGGACHDLASRRRRVVRQRLDPGCAVRGEILRAARS